MRARFLLVLAAFAIVAAVALATRGGDSGRAPGPAPATAKAPARPIAKPAREKVPTRAHVKTPAGTVNVPHPKLPAGRNSNALEIGVKVDRPAPGERLEVELPQRFVQRSESGLRFAGAPRLADDADGRVRLARSGRVLTVDVGRARAGDTAKIVIPRLHVPAGTYMLPLTWSGQKLPPLKVAVLAGTKEPDGEEIDASHDTDEESETFTVVSPNDPLRVVAAANDIDDSSSRKGVFISSDGGQTFSGLQFPTSYDVPSSSTNVTPQLGGDPILAADGSGNIWAGGLTVCTPSRRTPSRIFVVRIPAGSTTFASTGVGLPLLHGGSAGSQCSDLLQDKPMMTFGEGKLYVTWDDPDPSGAVNVVISSCDTTDTGGPARCDNADNWTAPVPVSGPAGSYITSDPAVDPSDGSVHVTWWDYSANNAIKIASCTSSCTTAASWSTAIAAMLDSTGGNPVPFACPIMAQPGGRAAPVPSLAFAPDGQAYLAWSDLRAGSGTTRCDDTLPQAPTHLTWDSFVASAPTVAGLTPASGASIIGDTSTGVSATNSDDWFPWVAVDPASGEAFVDVMSTTGDSTRRTMHPYVRPVSAAASGAPTLGTLTRMSATASNYSTEPCCSFGNDYGDYTGLSVVGGFPYAIWTRRRNASDDGDALMFVPFVDNPAPPPPPPPPTDTTPTIPTTPTTPPGTTTPIPPIKPAAPGLGASVPSRQRRSVVLKRGLLVRAKCRIRCRITFTLKLRGKRIARRTLTVSGSKSTRLRLTKSGRARLRANPRRKLLLSAVATTSAGGKQTVTRRVKLR
jgi:hypothetical protein